MYNGTSQEGSSSTFSFKKNKARVTIAEMFPLYTVLAKKSVSKGLIVKN